MGILFMAQAVLLLAGPPPPPAPLVLVLPILGNAPRELELPAAMEIADALLLQVPPGGVGVTAERPTSLAVPEDAEQIFGARARELGARVVVWGELLPPDDCPAPRRIKLRLLDTQSGVVLERVLCPGGAGAADLAQAVAVSVAASLRSGLIEGLLLPEKKNKPATGGLEQLARSVRRRRPQGGECPPCPKLEPPAPPAPCPACPELKPERPPRGQGRLSAAFVASSHPRRENPGLGAALAAGWSFGRRLEVGCELQWFSPNRLQATEVKAVYNRWPFAVWGRLLLGGPDFQGWLDVSAVLSWSRLEALLERFATSAVFDRFDPALRLRAGFRWWPARDVALELSAGASYWLLVQRYNYLYLGLPVEVLGLQRWSVEGGLSLLVAFGDGHR